MARCEIRGGTPTSRRYGRAFKKVAIHLINRVSCRIPTDLWTEDQFDFIVNPMDFYTLWAQGFLIYKWYLPTTLQRLQCFRVLLSTYLSEFLTSLTFPHFRPFHPFFDCFHFSIDFISYHLFYILIFSTYSYTIALQFRTSHSSLLIFRSRKPVHT